MNRLRIHVAYFIVMLVASLAAFPAAAQCNDGREGVLSDTFVGSTAVEWRMLVEHKAVTLTISAPCGLVVERTYEEGQSPFFDLKEIPAADPDGRYHWSLRISPHVDSGLEKELAAAHKNGGDGRELEYQLRQKGLLPAGPFTQSGTFTVFRGAIVPPDQKEEGAGGKLTAGVRPAASVDDCPVDAAPAVQTARLGTILPAVDRGGSTRAVAAAAETPRRITGADQVIPDDLIVQGSACVGFDCVNNEAFSFDTIRLKENNLRIKFEDTSVGSFPTNDWQLTANDSASGGSSKFSIEDITGSRVPFTVTAGASTNSIFVASTGRVGFRTSSPVLDLHISTSNTPAIRLEQTNAGGFTAQTWDIAGNEANFFVRDVTGGSRLPFRIRPGAPTSAIDISADGDVGIGSASPQERLHISDTAGSDGAKIFFQGSSASVGHRLGVRSDSQNVDLQAQALRNFTVIIDDDNNDSAVSNFLVSINGDPNSTVLQVREDERIRMNGASASATTHPLVVGTNATDGNGAFLTAAGVWSNGSSRLNKTAIRPLEATAAFETLAGLEPVLYRGLQQPDGEEYVGFIAEDVPDLVAMQDRKGLASMDIVGVLTKVVQEQQRVVEEQQKALSLLMSEVTELREKMKGIEAP